MANRHVYRAIWWRQLLTWDSLFPGETILYQVDRLTRTTPPIPPPTSHTWFIPYPAGPGRHWWLGGSFGESSTPWVRVVLSEGLCHFGQTSPRHWVWGFPGEFPTVSLSEHCTVPSSIGQVMENHPTWLLIPFRDRNTSVPLQFPSVSGDQGPLQLGLPSLRTPENCFFHLNWPGGRWVDFQKHGLAPMPLLS